MDLKEFTSPLPKPWLNINANSVHTGPGGGGASSTVYSKLGVVSVINTMAQTPLSGGNAAAIGSRTLPPLPVGSVVRMTASGEFNYLGGSGVQVFFSLTVNGVTQLQNLSFTSTTNINSNATEVQCVFTVLGSGQAAGRLIADIAPDGPRLSRQAPTTASNPTPVIAYNNAISNDVDLTVQFTSPGAGWSFLNCYNYTIEILSAA